MDESTRRSSAVRRRRTVGAVCALAVMGGGLLVGCGDDDKGGGDEASPPASSGSDSPGGRLTEDQRERKALIPKAKVTYDKALDAATKTVKDTEPVKAELDSGPGGSPRWETEVATSDGTAHAVFVDGVSGKAGKPRAEQDDADDRKELASWLGKAKVTAEQAAQVAIGEKKGTVAAIELDDDDSGKVVWSVDVVTPKDWNKTTYDIDVTNRKVLREHVDRD
ncbi:PepSY domain-containing protein [Streptomyces sp. NPDC048172]|uniref:PepSY domain-containing protein n=1 Tax=Streptomyces sp. NPDC048172 TaxID=3365505 RepID=UPI003711F781